MLLHILGYTLISLPFLAMFAMMIYDEGWKDFLKFTLIFGAVVGTLAVGVLLVTT